MQQTCTQYSITSFVEEVHLCGSKERDILPLFKRTRTCVQLQDFANVIWDIISFRDPDVLLKTPGALQRQSDVIANTKSERPDIDKMLLMCSLLPSPVQIPDVW